MKMEVKARKVETLSGRNQYVMLVKTWNDNLKEWGAIWSMVQHEPFCAIIECESAQQLGSLNRLKD